MYYGFDIGGTKIEFSVYDESLQCVFNQRIAAPQEDYELLVDAIDSMVFNADKQFSCIGQVGIGFPGVINKVDHTAVCANLPSLDGHDLRADLKERLGRDVALQNDANCFALSECFQGAAEQAECALAVTLGTGLGGAICFHKKIHSGRNFSAGEIGHIPIPGTMLQRYPELPLTHCGCGRQSCLETYCSGTGLAFLHKHYQSIMLNEAENAAELKGPEIIAAFELGCPVAVKTVTVYLDILAAGLAGLIMALDPDVIVIGGGLARFEQLYLQLPTLIKPFIFPNMQVPAIKAAEFGGEGGVRGAALLNY